MNLPSTLRMLSFLRGKTQSNQATKGSKAPLKSSALLTWVEIVSKEQTKSPYTTGCELSGLMGLLPSLHLQGSQKAMALP